MTEFHRTVKNDDGHYIDSEYILNNCPPVADFSKLRFNGTEWEYHMGYPVGHVLLPKRIQFDRFKGEKLPENTKLVTRPGRYGNPFPVSVFGLSWSMRWFVELVLRMPYSKFQRRVYESEMPDDLILKAIELAEAYVQRYNKPYKMFVEDQLKGFNLACTCPGGTWGHCHADWLLYWANEGIFERPTLPG